MNTHMTDAELKELARRYTRDETRKAQGVTLNAAERKIRDKLCKREGLNFCELMRYLLLKADNGE